MFVISLSNLMVTTQGLGGGTLTGATRLTWDTLAEAMEAATRLNAQHGLYAYIHPADRTDRTIDAVLTHSFGYSNG